MFTRSDFGEMVVAVKNSFVCVWVWGMGTHKQSLVEAITVLLWKPKKSLYFWCIFSSRCSAVLTVGSVSLHVLPAVSPSCSLPEHADRCQLPDQPADCGSTTASRGSCCSCLATGEPQTTGLQNAVLFMQSTANRTSLVCWTAALYLKAEYVAMKWKSFETPPILYVVSSCTHP